MKYRSEIDGLRALAVLPVLFFHADFELFSGGFIGVDVFFVISGFLITSIITEELLQDKFSLLNFYERRARRIMPALLFMGLGSFVVAYTVMPSDLFKDFGISLVNVYTFTSNVYFYLSSGYFSSIADEKPLLHTWSLAVEEQYYLFFPLLLMLMFNKVRNHILSTLMILLLLSLITAHYLTNYGNIDASFYLIASRAWELLAGSILVFINLSSKVKSTTLKEGLAVTGLLMLLFSFVYFDKNDPLPGFYSLIPVLGTMLVIVFASSATAVGKMLSQKWLVFVGLVSYSLYLWHQPILAFIKLKTIGEPNHLVITLGLVVSFLIAVVSWKYIEAPFRNKNRTSRSFVFVFAAIGIMVSVAAGLLVYFNDGMPQRFSNKVYLTDINYSPKRTECHTSGLDYMKPEDACRYAQDTEITWAVLGDSHGVEVAYALAEKLKENGEGVLHLTSSACPAAAFIDLAAPPGCSDWSKDAIDAIVKDEKINNVVLIYRYSYHFFGDHLASYPELPDRSPINHIIRASRELYASNVREYYWNSFDQTVQSLTAGNKNVIIVYPTPELPLHISKMMVPMTIFSSKPTIDPKSAVPVEYYKKRNHYVINKLNTLNYGENLIAVKPMQVFCGDTFCSAIENNRAYYADDDHLSVFGANKLVHEIIRLADAAFN